MCSLFWDQFSPISLLANIYLLKNLKLQASSRKPSTLFLQSAVDSPLRVQCVSCWRSTSQGWFSIPGKPLKTKPRSSITFPGSCCVVGIQYMFVARMNKTIFNLPFEKLYTYSIFDSFWISLVYLICFISVSIYWNINSGFNSFPLFVFPQSFCHIYINPRMIQRKPVSKEFLWLTPVVNRRLSGMQIVTS